MARTGALVLAAVGVVVACSEATTSPNAHGIADVIMSPDSLAIAVGDVVTIQARPVTASGATVDSAPLFWSTSDSLIATVDQHGVVTALGLGAVNIDASSAGVSPKHPTRLVVGQVPVASIVVAPTGATLRVGAAFQFSDTTKDADGNVITGRVVSWATSDSAVASVDQSGFVLAKKTGSTTISASAGNAKATATVTVSRTRVAKVIIAPTQPNVVNGEQTQLSATTEDSAGNVLVGRAVSWASSEATIATIDQTGTVTGKKPGSVTITATSESASSATTLTVQSVPVDAVAISPGASTLHVGQTITLTAVVTDKAGKPVSGATVAFASAAPAVATVASTGPLTATVTAVASGHAQITGTNGTKTGTATVTVTPVPVGSVTVAPANERITVGATVQLNATIKDSTGKVEKNPTVTWSTSNAAVAAVSPAGLVNASGVGSAVITATSGGQLGFATVTVAPVPVGSVTVTPKRDTVAVHAQQQLNVRVVDSLGRAIANPAVTWSSTNNAVAVVSSTGLVLGLGAGTSRIIAQSGAKADTNTTVVIAPVTSVVVTPAADTLFAAAPGNAVTLAAKTTPAGTAVTWSNGGSPLATVDQNGHVTATGSGAGAATITAAATGGASGSSAVTIIGHVRTVTPQAGTTTLGGDATSTSATAQLLDSFGTDVSATRAVTWTTSDKNTVTINNSGQPVVANPATTPVTLTLVSSMGPMGPDKQPKTVTITATSSDGAKGSIAITVSP